MRYLPGKITVILFVSFLFFGCKKQETRKPPKAVINETENIQLPKDSIILTGSGTSEDGKIVGYLWSQVSGPDVATIVSPGAAATVIRDLRSGNYIFQFAVTDNFGLTGYDTVSVVVMPSPEKTVSFQPDHNPNEVHIWGNSSELEGSSSNRLSEIGAVSWTYNGIPVSMRAAFRFDLSGIPVNATILNARLSLYSTPTPINGDKVHANSGTDNSMYIQRITEIWEASTVKWLHQPQTTSADQIEIPSTNDRFFDLVDIDVTMLVGKMVNNSANYGFMIRLKNEVAYTSRIFCSSTYSDASKHPKLVVTYIVN